MADPTRARSLALFLAIGIAFVGAVFILANRQWSARQFRDPAKVQVISVDQDAWDSQFADQLTEETPANVASFSRAGRPFGISNPGPGILQGHVTLFGEPPIEKAIPLDSSCSKEAPPEPIKTRFFVVGPKSSLADVIVKIVSPIPRRRWPAPTEPLVIGNFRCQFEPYISAAQAGQRLIIQNRDGIMHNAHIDTSLGEERNFAMLSRSKPIEMRLALAKEVRVKCDVHPWEYAYINVVEHPFFAVSDAEGNFEIKGLAPGKYLLEAAHRKAGTNWVQGVEVGKDGGSVEIKFDLAKTL